jgi:hypothetical protein
MLKRMWRSIAGKANPSMPSGRFNGSRLASFDWSTRSDKGNTVCQSPGAWE